jgi:glycine/D-amino acid oxidase-like deaminating enzyme
MNPNPPTESGPADLQLDALLVGGGVAGLWLLNRLTSAGYRALLLERDALGAGQTLASQGMIHGGLKYALSGRLTPAATAIADMPARWAQCLAGAGEIDLRAVTVRARDYHLFAAAGTLGRLATFFASRGLRGRLRRLRAPEFPDGLPTPHFRGTVYALADPVLDVPSLIAALAHPVAHLIYRSDADTLFDASTLSPDGARLRLGDQRIHARHLILTAGAGTAGLLATLGLGAPRMQRRPLHQVIVRAPGLPPLHAHCLTGIRRAEPRLTITSHPDHDGWLWYLGGQIATDGVRQTRTALIDTARRELTACFPWRSWQDARIDTLAIDRAEPMQLDGARPDEAFATATGPAGSCIVGWPVKLTLAPDLADRVLSLLPPPTRSSASAPPVALPLPRPAFGTVPWQRRPS